MVALQADRSAKPSRLASLSVDLSPRQSVHGLPQVALVRPLRLPPVEAMRRLAHGCPADWGEPSRGGMSLRDAPVRPNPVRAPGVTYVCWVAGVRQARAEQTRLRLVATARRLFSEKGYFATGTTEIVREAGVGTRGALYHHFANKESLFLAVLEEVEVDLGAKVGVRLTGATGRVRLAQALEGFLDASLEPEVRRILLTDGPAVLGWDAWRAVEARYGIGAIRLMLDEGARDGSVKVADAESMAHLLLSVIDEAALFIAHAHDPHRARAGAGASLAALLSGLAAS